MTTLEDCRAMDARDPLRSLRDLFALPEGVIYLDGNSLGVLPRATARRVARTVTEEWGQGLVGSWNGAGWFDLPRRLGDRIAPLIGAALDLLAYGLRSDGIAVTQNLPASPPPVSWRKRIVERAWPTW